jgi:hypothetical protein
MRRFACGIRSACIPATRLLQCRIDLLIPEARFAVFDSPDRINQE